MNSQEDSLIWPLAIVVVAFFLYKASVTSSATTLAEAQANAAAQAAANNDPWLAAAGGIGAIGSVLGGFSNLFESSD